MASFAAVDQSAESVDQRERDFTVVFIPCSTHEPIVERVVHQPAGDAIGCLTKHLQKHFRAASAALTPSQRANFKQMLVQKGAAQGSGRTGGGGRWAIDTN